MLAQPGDRAVLGPSTDGGYYVLGLKAPHWHLFADIDWSTERVFDQTLARAADIGLPSMCSRPGTTWTMRTRCACSMAS